MWHLEPWRLPLLLIELILENATSICRQGGFTELNNSAVYHPGHKELGLHNPFLPLQEFLRLHCDSLLPGRAPSSQEGLERKGWDFACSYPLALPLPRSAALWEECYLRESSLYGRKYPEREKIFLTFAPWIIIFYDAGKTYGIISNHSRFKNSVQSVQLLSHIWLFVTPWTATCQASQSITNSQNSLKLMSIESVMQSNHLILCHPLLPPSIFPSIRFFSDESVLHIRCPKYWSFSFSISPSNEYSGLISFRMDWLDLFAVQGTLKSLLQHHSSKTSILRPSAFFIVQLSQL